MMGHTRSTPARRGPGTIARLLIGLVLLNSACGTHARTDVDYNPRIDFKQYRTYSWRPGTPAPSAVMDERIVKAVNRQLQKKGLQWVSRDGDLKVAYHVAFDRRLEVSAWNRLNGPFWNGWNGPPERDLDVRIIPEGLLVVDLVDASRDQIVWRGVAKDELNHSEVDLESKIRYVTAELFKHYPPRP